MTHAHTRHLLAWAATCALTLPLVTPAQAQVIAQSKATITGLKITLIDLNTTDGIAPSMTMMGSLGGFVDNQREVSPGVSSLVPGVQDRTYADPSSSFSPLLSLQSQLRGGNVTVPTSPAGTTLSLGSTLSASTSADLKRATTLTEDVSYSYPDWRYDPSSGNFVYGTESFTGQRNTQSVSADATISLLGQSVPDGYETPYLRVSANTLVVIEGTSTLSSTVDAQRIMTLQGNDPALNTYLSGGANAQLIVNLSKEGYVQGSDPSGSGYLSGWSSFNHSLGVGYDLSGFYSNTGTNGEEAMFLDSPTLSANGLLTLQQSKQFRVSLANTSASFTDMWLTMNLGAVSEHSASSLSPPGAVFTPGAPVAPEVPTVPSVPNIPEPATWAQMGLGLIGLVAAVRRRRLTD